MPARTALAGVVAALLLAPAAAEASMSAEPQGPLTSRASAFAALTVLYISLNSSLNLLNRWSLGVYGFRFPLLLTSCHMAFGFAALAPVALRRPWHVHRRKLAKQWRGILAIGAFLALNITLNNASLLDMTLTLNQIIRSSIPVVTCLLAIPVERQRPTLRNAFALLVLTAGVMLAVWQGRVAGAPHAILLCLASTVCSGAMMTLIGRLLTEKLDLVHLTFYTAPVSLLCLAPFAFALEASRSQAGLGCWRHLDKLLQYLPGRQGAAATIIGITSLNALAYNLVHNAMIGATSAVTTTVLGEAKILLLLALSVIVLGEGQDVTPSFMAGCALAVTGFTLYTRAQLSKLAFGQSGTKSKVAKRDVADQPVGKLQLIILRAD
ncbi:hypothetical protein COHA_005894 [Chlorella ohadii]|uniref:Sugar phosphate transporter domain-containing protein n=1 Tax=Chlorella ohadii TaxID=2649997 RepID=A0AAD5H4B5_9CHLO|nr:hypothetical protein COHA_005894 [Chlorella ohadii]